MDMNDFKDGRYIKDRMKGKIAKKRPWEFGEKVREVLYSPGDTIASLYEVREVFAGGMGEVYLAYHRERRKHYALKTI